MFLILWEFEVKPGCEKRFEEAYGPEGDWARFFRRNSHYRETRLLRDAIQTNKYVTADFWDSQEAYENFRERNHEEYLALDRSFEATTERETPIGSFLQISRLHSS